MLGYVSCLRHGVVPLLLAKDLDRALLQRYGHVTDIRFVQDEPENQGGWPFLSAALPGDVKRYLPDYDLKMQLISREWSSAPSVGSLKVHKTQEEELLTAALG